MDPFKTPKFLKLQKQWAVKLKNSGFNDIEESEHKLKRHDDDWFHKHVDKLRYSTTQEYYLQCEVFGETHKFKRKKDRKIWLAHAEGLTLMQIEKLVKLKKSQISSIIISLQEAMDGKFRSKPDDQP